MGIYGALTSAVSGMRAQAFALEAISGNIANSQTTAYKRSETQFLDLVADAPLNRQLAGAVTAQSRSTNNIKGDIQNVSNATYVALNTSGFLIVEQKAGESDGNAIFAGTNFYTRRGDFELDKDGRLVNGAGYYLKGLPVDRTSGNISGSVPGVIQISNAFLAAQQSSQIDYRANLPEIPLTANYDPNTDNSELFDIAAAPNSTVDAIVAEDETAFLDRTISGGAITLYGENGGPTDVQLRWAKTDSTENSAGANPDTWNLYYMSDSNAATGETKWTRVQQDFQFADNGDMTLPTDPVTTITGMTVNGTNLGDVSFSHGAEGITQYSDANGTANVTTLRQDGYGAGEFVSVQISDSGRVVATYSNGKRIDVAQVATANFSAVNELKRLDGGAYAATSESGDAIIDLTGEGIVGGALEASNTDISDEFTKLIVTQQAYAAGTRIVTTADEMLQEALNMVR
ncbi:hypothetical protein GCM10007989_06890 [Devosia pacifica]|uniref:Flagellar hook protein FlgE n=1 Tax=Devosia pacifica TaxID=1335967 RepID=A0A918RZI3_9HYPH|nr:flagellar hook-basal body complex protein [Devosia pacifica]GHA14810.1 hypothetical protein GCM10007989_06890 [Devosia pacifica]